MPLYTSLKVSYAIFKKNNGTNHLITHVNILTNASRQANPIGVYYISLNSRDKTLFGNVNWVFFLCQFNAI